MGKGINTNTPLYHDGDIFVTNGYDHTAVMISLSQDCRTATFKWKNDVMPYAVQVSQMTGVDIGIIGMWVLYEQNSSFFFSHIRKGQVRADMT